jgi:peroxiredoxin
VHHVAEKLQMRFINDTYSKQTMINKNERSVIAFKAERPLGVTKALLVVFILLIINTTIQAQDVDPTRIVRPMADVVKKQTEQAGQEWMKLWNEGPKVLAWDMLPVQEGDKAPDFELESSTNELTKLSDLWSEEPILLIFWRHTGCGCGFIRADSIRQSYDKITDMGIKVVIITQAEPERAAFYAKEQSIKGTLLSDPNYKVYRAYGLLDGNGPQILGTPNIDYSIGEKLQKDRIGTQRALVDNPWLLPGEFIIDKSGVIQFAFRYSYCNDIPEYWQLEVELEAVVQNK